MATSRFVLLTRYVRDDCTTYIAKHDPCSTQDYRNLLPFASGTGLGEGKLRAFLWSMEYSVRHGPHIFARIIYIVGTQISCKVWMRSAS